MANKVAAAVACSAAEAVAKTCVNDGQGRGRGGIHGSRGRGLDDALGCRGRASTAPKTVAEATSTPDEVAAKLACSVERGRGRGGYKDGGAAAEMVSAAAKVATEATSTAATVATKGACSADEAAAEVISTSPSQFLNFFETCPSNQPQWNTYKHPAQAGKQQLQCSSATEGQHALPFPFPEPVLSKWPP